MSPHSNDGGADEPAGSKDSGGVGHTDAPFRELMERRSEPGAVIVEGRFVYVNPALSALVGDSPERPLLGRRSMEVIHPDDHAEVIERIGHVQATNAAAGAVETRCLRADGSVIYLDNIVVPVRYEGREAVGVLGRDVTARRAEADQMRDAEELFRLTFEHAAIGMAMCDLHGRWLKVNQALCDMVGYTNDELLGMTFKDITHPDDVAGDMERMARVLSGEIRRYERSKRYHHKNGGIVEVSVQVSMAYTRDGAPRHFVAQVQDVTTQRATERALRESERRAQALARHIPIGMFETGPGFTYTFVNERWCQMTGYTLEQMVGRPWDMVIHPDDRQTVIEAWAECERLGKEFSLEYRYLSADGRTVWILGSAVTLRDDVGNVLGYIGSVADITERKQVQSQLLLNDRMASVGTLASGVAHEINNPLAYVTANLDLIAEEVRGFSGSLPPDRLRDLEDLVREGRQGAEKVRRIVRGLKTFARGDEEQRVRLDVHSVLDLSVSMVAHELKHRARVVRDYQWVPAVEADEARLGQVFINLLINAVQSIPEGHADRHTIRLVTRTNAAGQVFVEVHDSGSGIAAEHRDHIFDPFYTTRPVGRGAGLGLSICHGIVTALGGQITFESDPGRGSTFTVALPGVVIEVEPKIVPAQAKDQSRREGRILVVDDDPLVGTTLRRVLEREHEVTVVESGREALTLIGAGERYDVILCDVMMPQMTGIELYAEVGRSAPDQQAGGARAAPTHPVGRRPRPLDPSHPPPRPRHHSLG